MNSQNYFITIKGDSIGCKEVTNFVTNSQGKMVGLEYIDILGKVVKQKKKEIPDIKTICMNGTIYDRMPLKLKKPDSYYRYGQRFVDGKIRVTIYDNQTTSYELKKNFDGTSTGRMGETTSGTYLRHVKMPDGTKYELSGLKGLKAIKKIREYMLQCKEFEKEYNTNPKYKQSSTTFEETVIDYNKLCKNK